MKASIWGLLFLSGLLSVTAAAGAEPVKAIKPVRAADAVDYVRHIKPILSEHCYDCHGVDAQESGFRLDTAALAVGGGDRGPAVVAGNSEKSRLYQSLIGKSDVAVMPKDAPPLTKAQIALIKRWIDQGAKYPKGEVAEAIDVKSDHWAFQSIERKTVPRVNDANWIRNPIDTFILARLEKEGVKPSPEANRLTLIRRLSLDLRGVTPALDEVDAYLADGMPGAYERLVERMLASPQFGERWGRHWLDVARYADSNGFTIDSARPIWKYRDWVIDAINGDMTFDRFTTEQLAGDLLPHATREQVIATGFHRNTLTNEEGGTDDEQFRVESVVDRINTTGAAYLGLSIGCARCHEHKFDPITQREYYDLFAIFNDCDEPTIQVPTPVQSTQLKALRQELAVVEKQLKQRDAEYSKGLPEWEAQIAREMAGTWTHLSTRDIKTVKGSVLTRLDDKSLVVDFSIPANDTFILSFDTPMEQVTAIRLEALTHASLPKMGPGRAKNGNFILSECELFAAPLTADGTPVSEPKRVKLKKAVADHSQVGYPVSAAIDGDQQTGWAIGVQKGSLNVNRAAVFIPAEAIGGKYGSRLTVKLHQNHRDAGYLLGRFRLSAGSAPADLLVIPADIRNIIATPAAKRTKKQQAQLAVAFRQTDLKRQPLAAKRGTLKRREERLVKSIPRTLVMRKRKQPRETYLHIRGDFLRKGARVTGGVPAALGSLPKSDKKPTRLDLAKWLVAPAHPLTARVTVNRYWQRLFGKGLVATENDFGSQGTPPTHPQLLDWLAGDFVQREWGTKSIIRRIVTSSTYRQSSAVREELAEIDSQNNLLARQSRVRLEAEIVRDVSLAAGGLLTNIVGGPSVYPPQPAGIYVLTQQKKAWPENKGLNRHRRGMYTFFWRSSPYPMLPTFDAPNANITCTRRARSNTPLQALTLANDRSFVEISQALAARVLTHDIQYDEGRIRFAFRLCLTRAPSSAELKRLTRFLEQQRTLFGADEKQAVLAAGASGKNGSSPAEAAAWTAVARVLLNLDEFITRE